MDGLEREERRWLDEVYCGDRLTELSVRSAVLGALLAALMVTLNVYMGLKTSFGEGGALIACILGFSVMKLLRQIDHARVPFTKLELNVSQTMAGAAGSLGAIDNVIPALFLLGGATGAVAVLHRPDGTPLVPTWWEIGLWCLFTSMLGVSFAVPMRRALIVTEKLKFPTGTAAAETIRTLYSEGASGVRQAGALAALGASSLLVTFLRDWNPASWIGDKPELTRWLRIHSHYSIESIARLFGSWSPSVFGCPAASLTLGVAMSPMLLGAGFLIGPRIAVSLVIGATAAWIFAAPVLNETGVLAEIATAAGAAEPVQYGVIVKWTLWPALGLMLASALGSMAVRGKLVWRSLSSLVVDLRTGRRSPAAHLDLPMGHWLAGLLVATGGIELLLVWRFHVAWWVGLLAVPVAFVLSVVAMRAAGETDLVPTGTVGKVTQLTFGAVNPGHVDANVLTAGISTSAAGESSYMMVDLKAGHLLGSTPRRLAYAQYLGIVAGALVATPVFLLFVNTYGLFSDALPAPGAQVWAGLAQVLSEGGEVLPRFAAPAFWLAFVVGLAVTVLDGLGTLPRRFLPSAMGMGLAMILPAHYTATLFLGAMLLVVLRRFAPGWVERYGAVAAAGGIAGEGFGGLLVALLLFFHLM